MIPVILSGGAGTRLWPLSRASFPKQFVELLNESLLEKTLKRLKPLGSPWALTVAELKVLTTRVFRDHDLPQDQMIFEPMGRNTAPAIALLCRVLELRGQAGEIAAVFPADHLVVKEKAFQDAIACAEAAARKGFVATLGIRPDHPATGFGYIETKTGSSISHAGLKAYEVAGFREKPDLKTAEKFVQAGTFFWNAGMFVFEVQTMISNFKTLLPELWAVMSKLKADLSNITEVYQQAPAISIDYGIMEKLEKQVCVPCDIGWSDLGSWDDIARMAETGAGEKLNNLAHVAQSNSKNCFVYSSERKSYGLVDVEDLIVVDTEDALLVSRKGKSQNVRAIVEQLAKDGKSAAKEHVFDIRPWGRFAILRDEDHYKSKLIVVDPNAQLSYQSHTKRAEHWIIVQGQGEVVLNDKLIAVKAGDSVFIPLGAKHRMRNTGSIALEFVEVQTGSYFGEDDITRYQDDYNRK